LTDYSHWFACTDDIGSLCPGSAVGFRLDSLLKLTDTRATNNKMTLMHYLCKVWAHFPLSWMIYTHL